MLVLLPPSEGKAISPRRGRPLDLESLSFPGLTQTRSRLVQRLESLCTEDPDQALAILGLSPGQADEVRRNARLSAAPTLAAAALYTGVLYDALGLATLDPSARRRAGRSLLVFSGLWGVLRPGDRVAPYRLSADVTLPGMASPGSHWREPIAEVMRTEMSRSAGRLVLDLRSTSYASLWRPDPAVAGRVVTVRVLQERRPGDPSSRMVVSHFNKATKGRLVRSLLESGADPRTHDGFVAAVRQLGYVAEPGPPPKPGKPASVDVVVSEL